LHHSQVPTSKSTVKSSPINRNPSQTVLVFVHFIVWLIDIAVWSNITYKIPHIAQQRPTSFDVCKFLGKFSLYSSGGPGISGPVPFPLLNLPSNISKTQDFRPKIPYIFFYLWGKGPSLRSAHPLFEISGSATIYYFYTDINTKGVPCYSCVVTCSTRSLC
jgi:hypothetical protein